MLGNSWSYMIFARTKESLDQYRGCPTSRLNGHTPLSHPLRRKGRAIGRAVQRQSVRLLTFFQFLG
jgi:hypothetical protein